MTDHSRDPGTPRHIRPALYLPNFGTFADPRLVAELAVEAEGAGWEGLFVWDHTVRHEGDFDVADPWVVLAAVAAATSRLVLGPLVTPLPRRRPWNVAKAAVTLDHLSGGRVVLGVGLGSPRGPEFGPFDEETDLRTRGDMLDEGLEVVRATWTGEPVTHHGTHHRVDGIRFLPRPVAGTIPVWAAAESTSGRAVRRAATCDGIFPIGRQPAELPALIAAVAAARPGGDLSGYDVATSSPDDDLRRWQGSGLTWWLRVLARDLPARDALALARQGPPPG